ncbi:proteasome assembly chaperone family protein [Halorubrum gandharaense]
MVEIRTRDDVELEAPVLVEGLPGVGLAGKIAADHLIEELEMVEYGEIVNEGLPPVTVFEDDDRGVKSPIRLFAAPDANLLVLQSAVPIEAMEATPLVETFTEWIADHGVTPVYLAGVAEEREPGVVPDVYGIATGDAGARLDEAEIPPPHLTGMIQGPGGAFLNEAKEREIDAVGLLVESDPRFPDPQGARQLIDEGIAPLAGVDVDTSRLDEEAEEIVDQREELMAQLQRAAEEGQQVSTRGMFQ